MTDAPEDFGPDTGSSSSDEDGQVSEAQGGVVSDGDSPAGDPDLAEGEQSDPGTEPHTSDDHDDED